MQVIAPDFQAVFGGKSPAREEERAGDGLFDALLREDEARHAPAPLPPREPREPREAVEPGNDNIRPDAAPADSADDAASHEVAADEPAATQEAASEEADAETTPASGEAQPHDGTEAEMDPNATPEDPTAGVAAQADAPRSAAQAPATPSGGTVPAAAAPSMPALVETAAASGVPAAQAAAIPGTPLKRAASAPATGPARESAAAATPPASAQPAKGAAAATRRAAGEAAPAATAKEPNPGAAAQRQSPTAPAEPVVRTSARKDRADGQPAVVVSQAAMPEARPAAALGGGAATAALARAGDGGAKTAPTAGEAVAAASDSDQQTAAAKPTANPGQPVRVTEMPVPSDKGPGRGPPAAAGATGEPGAQQPGQTVAATAVASGGAGGTGPVHSTSFSEALAQARHGAAANPAEQIAVQVQRAQVAGQDQISIKLHPAELGRIEVKLEHGGEGTLRAVISAERSETLDLLQRDARGLERALQEAGVKTDSGSLSFNLRGQGQNHEQRAGGQDGSGRGAADASPSGGAAMPAEAQAYRSSHSGALDIRV